MAAASTEEQVRSIHQYKITPPSFDGNYNNYEEWKFKFGAYAGLIHQDFPRLLNQAEQATSPITETQLRTAAESTSQAEAWIKLSSELQFILVSICKGPAATACRQQGVTSNGFETWRQLNIRFSIPVGTRSIGYLTKLLKPSLDEHRFEEAFATWEFEINRYERDNGTSLPDNIKIAVLLNETRGALQQHLQLTASNTTDYNAIRSIIVEYHRAAASFTRMQQLTNQQPDDKGPAPMDIGAATKGKKGKGKGKSKGHHNGKGKGYNQHPTKDITTAKAKANGSPSDRAILSKDQTKVMAAKENNHHQTTAKAKENHQQQLATNVASQVTSPRTAEFPSTTTTWISHHLIHITLGMKINSNSMTATGTIRILPNRVILQHHHSNSWHYHHHQLSNKHRLSRASTIWRRSTWQLFSPSAKLASQSIRDLLTS